MYALTSAESGEHNVLACVSAFVYVLLPIIVYPRKKCVPESLKERATPDTFFAATESGWINSEMYLECFCFFLEHIPHIRLVLLNDGHASHTSIEVIASANNVHILCLPAHTTDVLQPLDVVVFKSFKSQFSKVCNKYMSQYPGRVVTADKLASLVAETWPHSVTSVNIMSGLKKTRCVPT